MSAPSRTLPFPAPEPASEPDNVAPARRPPGRIVRFLWRLLHLDQTVALTQEMEAGLLGHKQKIERLFPVTSRSEEHLKTVMPQMKYLVETVSGYVDRLDYYEQHVPAIRRAKATYDAEQAERMRVREEARERGEARRRRDAIRREGPNGVFVPPADAGSPG